MYTRILIPTSRRRWEGRGGEHTVACKSPSVAGRSSASLSLAMRAGHSDERDGNCWSSTFLVSGARLIAIGFLSWRC